MTSAAILDARSAPGDVVARDALQPLLARRDGPGLARFGAQVGLFAGACTASVWLVGEGSRAAWGAVAVAGVSLATFFASLHEAGHGTAFRTVLAERAGRLGQRGADAAGAAVLPRVPLGDRSALLPRSVSGRLFPFVPERARRRVAWESRAVLAVRGAGVGAGLAWIDGFAVLLAVCSVSHVVLGLYLMPEHTGLPHGGSQLERTRSVEAGRVVRWLMWNMPLHAVHHAQPGVPFHAVPALHRLLEPRLDHVAKSYAAFHREAFRRAFARR